MLNHIIAFALSQRVLIILLSVALLIAGYFSFSKLPIDAFPDVSSTQVQIIIKAAGMTPEEVESRIVAPIEQELLGIPHQSMLRSQSKYAIAIITLDFADGTDRSIKPIKTYSLEINRLCVYFLLQRDCPEEIAWFSL